MRIIDPSRGSLLDTLLFEATTDLNGTQAPTNLAGIYSLLTGRGALTGGPAANFWGAAGAPAVVYDAARGRRLIEIVSNAGARQVIHGGWGASFGVDFAAVGDPQWALLRPMRRYTWLLPVAAPVRGGVIVNCGTGATNGLLDTLGTDPFFGWSSDPAINGGRWTVRYRRTAGGGVTTADDSGVALDATWHILGVRYTEGARPTLEAMIDGRTVTKLVGRAALPDTIANNAYRLGLGMPAGAGTTVRCDDAVYRIETVE